jgi:hypothetical protein
MLLSAYKAEEIVPNRQIVVRRRKKVYHITRFGLNFFKLFYDLNYEEIPKEFVIYYNNDNDICEKETIFLLMMERGKK